MELAKPPTLGRRVARAAPALGAPSNGANVEVLPVTCGGVSQYVLVGIGLPAWGSDAGGNLDGTMFIVQEIDVRVYAGSLTTEPMTPPIDAFFRGPTATSTDWEKPSTAPSSTYRRTR